MSVTYEVIRKMKSTMYASNLWSERFCHSVRGIVANFLSPWCEIHSRQQKMSEAINNLTLSNPLFKKPLSLIVWSFSSD